MIDWNLLIIRLRGKGKNYDQIALGCGISRTAISGYSNEGYQPRFENGLSLINYASKHLTDDELRECRISGKLLEPLVRMFTSEDRQTHALDNKDASNELKTSLMMILGRNIERIKQSSNENGGKHKALFRANARGARRGSVLLPRALVHATAEFETQTNGNREVRETARR